MKKIMWCLVASAAFIMESCEEKGVPIDFGSSGIVKDTAYMASKEAPQARTVLIEEFTGASCTNCPRGHETVAAMLDANPDNMVAVAYHTYNGGGIFLPVNEGGHVSKYDFRDSLATDIGTYIYGTVSSIPEAGVDRVPGGPSNTMQLDRPYWATAGDARKVIATPVNMELSSTYNTLDNEVTVKVKIAYTSAVSKKQKLTLAVVESHIIDLQLTSDSIAYQYEHNHVLRKFLHSLYSGVSVLDSMDTKAAGQVYEYQITFTPDPEWKLENCDILAFVSNNEGTDREVMQAKQVPLE